MYAGSCIETSEALQKPTRLLDLKRDDFIKATQDLKLKSLQPFEIVELAEGMINLINTSVERELDVLFFIDKSARPIHHFFN